MIVIIFSCIITLLISFIFFLIFRNRKNQKDNLLKNELQEITQEHQLNKKLIEFQSKQLQEKYTQIVKIPNSDQRRKELAEFIRNEFNTERK